MAAHQAPLSLGFSRQEYWSGLLFPTPGDLSNPGIEPASLASLALAGRFFNHCATWETQIIWYFYFLFFLWKLCTVFQTGCTKLHSLVGGDFNKQGNIFTKLILGSLKTSSSPHLPIRIVKNYLVVLTGFICVLMASAAPYLLKNESWEQLPMWEW